MLISYCLAVETWTLYLYIYMLYLYIFLPTSCFLPNSTEKECGVEKRLEGIRWLDRKTVTRTWAFNYGIIFLGLENLYCKTLQVFIINYHKHWNNQEPTCLNSWDNFYYYIFWCLNSYRPLPSIYLTEW